MQHESRGVPRRIRVEPFCSQTLMLSPLCSQQCSKLTSASPVDLLAEDGFSIIGFSILFSFPRLQSSCPLGGLLPLQSFVAFIRFSDRIGSVINSSPLSSMIRHTEMGKRVTAVSEGSMISGLMYLLRSVSFAPAALKHRAGENRRPSIFFSQDS